MAITTLPTKKDISIKEEIIDHFANLEIDVSWSFAECTRKETSYITHSYHRYPAKFIPQLARRLIEEYTEVGEIVVDPFMGCGTTIIESLMAERIGIGVDINPVAYLISKAKSTPIEPKKLEREFTLLTFDIKTNNITNIENIENERIDYWFPDREKKRKLSIILSRINQIEDENIRTFFLCGFSNILKNCSIWLMKSNKPTRDFKKEIPEPFLIFKRQIEMMLRKNREFYQQIPITVLENITDYVKLKCGDARNLPVKNNTVGLIVTSPPYVTSYEYADLHQLTILWFQYSHSLSEFRKKFIGTAHHREEHLEIGSEIGRECVKDLELKDKKKSREVAMYFGEMRQCFIEMFRKLKKYGKACIVIGDTSFKGVNVPNAEVFVEQMLNIGFDIYKIIKREIPSKILPQIRDSKTGRFTSSKNHNKILAYPHEYIIIMEKK
ncbi:MAG: hypothetical protein J7L54_06675 [Elusimicrobia bacterium]|nr:hypothetical protein [Elusimicrobiota bacterium]